MYSVSVSIYYYWFCSRECYMWLVYIDQCFQSGGQKFAITLIEAYKCLVYCNRRQSTASSLIRLSHRQLLTHHLLSTNTTHRVLHVSKVSYHKTLINDVDEGDKAADRGGPDMGTEAIADGCIIKHGKHESQYVATFREIAYLQSITILIDVEGGASWYLEVRQQNTFFREQGLILALSAFFSMAETSITTLSPWKVRELAEKKDENGVFKLLRTDITRFLTTILIRTTVVNIGATALFTEAATPVFGEAGVSAATGVMTVVVLLLTEITPKSIAVHNATAVARVHPVAWLSIVLYSVGRVVTFLSMRMLKILGLKGKSEP
ncbi:hypothetical protein L2E82_35395 [Cichorium intybus]|uniref:Uncharacterized protein n=1 Tax=Cichorium intybus TaxID=13427 RepID=A0ACB9BNP8_CICIN|nr:hypothetical protein L2E82_35395 [Cichorium intybus]